MIYKSTLKLPEQYQQVKYLENHKAIEYLDIGYKHKPNTWVDTQFEYLSNDIQGFIFGSNSSANLSFFAGNDKSTSFYISIGGIDFRYNTSILTETKTHLVLGASDFLYNDYYRQLSLPPTEGDITWALFARHGATYTSKQGHVRFYTFRIYEGTFNNQDESELMMDLVPCIRKVDSKPGMYDLISNVFFTNLNKTGEFITGPTVDTTLKPIQEIQFSQNNSEYTELEWLNYKYNTAMDTGVQITDRIKVAFDTEFYAPSEYPVSSTNRALIGAGTVGVDCLMFKYNRQAHQPITTGWRLDVGSLSNVCMDIPLISSQDDYHRWQVELDLLNNNVSSRGELLHTFTHQDKFANNTLKIGNNSMDTAYRENKSNRLRYVKIWDNNILIRDYIPVIKNYKAGIYDKVSGTFITSSYVSPGPIKTRLISKGIINGGTIFNTDKDIESLIMYGQTTQKQFGYISSYENSITTGKNLLTPSSFTKQMPEKFTYLGKRNGCDSYAFTSSGFRLRSDGNVGTKAQGTGYNFAIDDFFKLGLTWGDTITFSVWVKGSIGTVGSLGNPFIGMDLKLTNPNDNIYELYTGTKVRQLTTYVPTSTYTRYSATITIPQYSPDYDCRSLFLEMTVSASTEQINEVYFLHGQLEKGNVATDYESGNNECVAPSPSSPRALFSYTGELKIDDTLYTNITYLDGLKTTLRPNYTDQNGETWSRNVIDWGKGYYVQNVLTTSLKNCKWESGTLVTCKAFINEPLGKVLYIATGISVYKNYACEYPAAYNIQPTTPVIMETASRKYTLCPLEEFSEDDYIVVEGQRYEYNSNLNITKFIVLIIPPKPPINISSDCKFLCPVLRQDVSTKTTEGGYYIFEEGLAGWAQTEDTTKQGLWTCLHNMKTMTDVSNWIKGLSDDDARLVYQVATPVVTKLTDIKSTGKLIQCANPTLEGEFDPDTYILKNVQEHEIGD